MDFIAGIFCGQWTSLEVFTLCSLALLGLNSGFWVITADGGRKACFRPFFLSSLCMLGVCAGLMALVFAFKSNTWIASKTPLWDTINLSWLMVLVAFNFTLCGRQYSERIFPNPGWRFFLVVLPLTTALAAWFVLKA